VRVGVFGGAFDPPHCGHVEVARAARRQLALDRLLVVPMGRPALRPPPATPGELRLRMARAAFAGEPATEVSALELERPGVSYTVDTLQELRPLGELFLVVGGDQWAAFERWRDPERIRELATIAVVARPGSPPPEDEAVRVEMPPMAISSSGIRRAIREGRPVPGGIPPAVWAVIRREGLYGLEPC
jgi:nicotinate-nucleotide adenylyltransferase